MIANHGRIGRVGSIIIATRHAGLALVVFLAAACGASATPAPTTPPPNWTAADVSACIEEYKRAFEESYPLVKRLDGRGESVRLKNDLAKDLDTIAAWAERFPWHYADPPHMQEVIRLLREGAARFGEPMTQSDYSQSVGYWSGMANAPVNSLGDRCSEIGRWVDQNVLVP